jgi:hypothetical protein
MKIEKNIPITTYPHGKYASLAREMQAGDSVLCLTMKEVITIRAAIYRTGYKAVTRKLPDGGWRLWKIKKEDKGDE